MSKYIWPLGTSEHARHFSNQCDIYKVAKVVKKKKNGQIIAVTVRHIDPESESEYLLSQHKFTRKVDMVVYTVYYY